MSFRSFCCTSARNNALKAQKLISIVLAASLILGCELEEEPANTAINTNISIELEYPRPNAQVAGMTLVKAWADSEVLIESIGLYVGETLVSRILQPPYEFSWDTLLLENGDHLLKVVATNTDGLSQSDEYQVTVHNEPVVDDIPPIISFIHPKEGSELIGVKSILVSLTDQDASGISNPTADYLEIFVNGELIKTLVSPPWRHLLDTRFVSNGDIDISVTAYDFARNATSLSTSNITVNNPLFDAVCGDNVLSLTEQCDDGNILNGDLCSATCNWELDRNEPNNQYREATSINTVELIQGNAISGREDHDYFKFDIDGNAITVIQTLGHEGDCNSDLDSDTVVTLFDADGLTILSSDDDGGQFIPCSEVVVRDLTAGSYYLSVKDYSGASTGFYHLKVLQIQEDEFTNNDTRDTAATIIETPFTINNLVDIDRSKWFTFPVTSGVRYKASIIDALCIADDRSAINLTVFSSDGTTSMGTNRELGEDDGYIPRICAEVEFTAPDTETFYLLVDQQNHPLWEETFGISVEVVD